MAFALLSMLPITFPVYPGYSCERLNLSPFTSLIWSRFELEVLFFPTLRHFSLLPLQVNEPSTTATWTNLPEHTCFREVPGSQQFRFCSTNCCLQPNFTLYGQGLTRATGTNDVTRLGFREENVLEQALVLMASFHEVKAIYLVIKENFLHRN